VCRSQSLENLGDVVAKFVWRRSGIQIFAGIRRQKMVLTEGRGRGYFDKCDWISYPLLLLMSNPDARGSFNMTSPSPVTNGEFAKLMVSVQGGLTVLPVPSVLLKLALSERASCCLTGNVFFQRK